MAFENLGVWNRGRNKTRNSDEESGENKRTISDISGCEELNHPEKIIIGQSLTMIMLGNEYFAVILSKKDLLTTDAMSFQSKSDITV